MVLMAMSLANENASILSSRTVVVVVVVDDNTFLQPSLCDGQFFFCSSRRYKTSQSCNHYILAYPFSEKNVCIHNTYSFSPYLSLPCSWLAYNHKMSLFLVIGNGSHLYHRYYKWHDNTDSIYRDRVPVHHCVAQIVDDINI